MACSDRKTGPPVPFIRQNGMTETGLDIALIVSPHLVTLPPEWGLVVPSGRRCFLVLHRVLDIFLDDHLVALRTAGEAATVATSLVPRSALFVILAVRNHLDGDAHLVARIEFRIVRMRYVVLLVILRASGHGVVVGFGFSSRVGVGEIVHLVVSVLGKRLGAPRHAVFEGDTHEAGVEAVEEGFEARNAGRCDANGEGALREDIIVHRVERRI